MIARLAQRIWIFILVVTTIVPRAGSLNGGTRITLYGRGMVYSFLFPPASAVEVIKSVPSVCLCICASVCVFVCQRSHGWMVWHADPEFGGMYIDHHSDEFEGQGLRSKVKVIRWKNMIFGVSIGVIIWPTRGSWWGVPDPSSQLIFRPNPSSQLLHFLQSQSIIREFGQIPKSQLILGKQSQFPAIFEGQSQVPVIGHQDPHTRKMTVRRTFC